MGAVYEARNEWEINSKRGPISASIKAKSLDGLVLSAVSKDNPSRRVTELEVGVFNEDGSMSDKKAKVILEKEGPRIDSGEIIRVYHKGEDNGRYFAGCVEILDKTSRELKFRYIEHGFIYLDEPVKKD
jgi:hypothetical protein